MKLHSTRLLATALAAGILAPATTYGTNGYFLIGYGSSSRAMGGVGVALGQDGIAAASNPAAMADVELNTMRVDVSGEFFHPPRSVSHNSSLLPANNEESASNLFLIPAMGGIYKFNRKLTVGMAAVGGGFGTRYDQSWDAGTGTHNGQPAPNGYFFNFNGNASDTLGVQLMQLQMLPSLAYKINKQHTVGMSLAFGVQTFRAFGLQAFGAPASPLNYTSDRNHLTNNGNDWSYGGGIRLGWLGKFIDNKLQLGANYSSRVYMTRFDKYKGLFAEQGDFDIPENYAIGLAWNASDKLTLAFDVQKILYSDIASVGNPGPDIAAPGAFYPAAFGCPSGVDIEDQICALGRDKGMGFGWDDQTVYKLGVRYDYNDQWTLRAGLNYGEAPVPDDQVLFALIAPAVVEKHITLGFSYRPSRNIEWGFNYMHAFENELTGKTVFYPDGINDVADLRNDNAALTMYQNSLGITFAFKM